MSEWQPIETAPKDGTIIIMADGRSVFAGYWGRAQRVFGAGSDKLFPWVFLDETNGTNACMDKGNGCPTHWMPLPNLPVSP